MEGWPRCEASSDPGVEAAGKGQAESAVGGFPALDQAAFDESGGSFTGLASGLAGLLGTLSGPFVLDVTDRQPQQLDHRVVVGKWPRFLMILRSW